MAARTGLVYAAALALLQGCGDSPAPPAAEAPAAPDAPLAEPPGRPPAEPATPAEAAPDETEGLGAVRVEPRLKPRFKTFDQGGGSVALGPISATFDPGAIEDRVEVALVRAAPRQDWSPEWAEALQPTGVAFSLVTRGEGVIRAGRIAVTLDPASVPEGWEPRVLCRSAARACAPAGADPVDIRGFRQIPYGPEEERKAGERADALAAGRFDPRAAESEKGAQLLAFTCLSKSGRDGVEFPITAGDAPGDHDVFEVVLTKDLRHEHLVEDGRLFACVYYLFSPPHDLDGYHAELVQALKRARQRGRDLGLPDPPHALSITVVDEIKSDSRQHLQAVTSATRIALRRDLLAQWPRGEPSVLEYVVAHEYFHVLQAFSMTLDTYNALYNEWALEGGAEWFAHTLYDNYREGWPAPTKGLERHSYGAAAFCIYLADRYGERFMTETLGLLRDRALGGRKHTEPSLQIAYGLRLEESSFTEALDRVLRERGESLSEAWRGFAPAYLYRRTFQSGDQGTGEKPGLWYGLEEHEFPVGEDDAWEEHSLLGSTADYPLELFNLTLHELSAAAVRLTDLFDRGVLHLELQDVKCFMGGMEPVFCRQLGTPRVRVAVYGEKAGEVTFLGDDIAGEGTWTRTVESFGRGGDYESVVVVLANEGWRRRRDCPEAAAEMLLTEMREMSYKVVAYVSDREADRAPSAVHVTPPGAGRVWCVSKSRSEDEDGNRCFGTLSAAIVNKEVKEGHEIVVDPDVYEEAVLVSKPLVIRSKVPGMATIKAPGQVITIAVPDVSVANFVLIGGQSTVPVVGIEPDAHNAYVAGNVIVSGGPGVSVRQASLPNISSNWIACSQRGINVDQATGAVIVDNVIAPPVVREGLAEPDVSGARVEIPGPQPGVIEQAIQVYRSPSVTVAGNEAITWDWRASFEAGLHALESPGLSMRNNVFRSSHGHGALIGGSSPVSASENLLAGQVGLAISAADEVTLSGNLVEARNNAATLTQINALSSVRNRFICGEGAALAWAMELLRIGGVNSGEDFFDGRWGGGFGARECGTLAFERCRFAGVDTGAQIEQAQTVLFNGCAFEQSSKEDNASTAGDGWALSLKQVETALVRDSAVAAPGRAVRLESCKVPVPWQGVRLTSRGYGGLFVKDTSLELEDVMLHPKLQVPLKADLGEISIKDLRFAYPDGEPLVVLKTLSLAPGVLHADDLSQMTAGRMTPLLPWWWTLYARAAVADPDVDTSYYRLRFELDLERTALPVPLGDDVPAIVSWYPEPPWVPVKAVADGAAVSALEADVDMAHENPEQHSSRQFTLMLVPKALIQKR